jgi:pimeloyl-ACP methyl ester carboxylesterase
VQPQPTSGFFTSHRLRLHYVEWGDAGAPFMLLVHGGRDHARSWDTVARELARDWHVIAPDLRGHGDSAWAPHGGYDMADFVYDLSELVEHLGGPPGALVGHSLGGNIALRYAGAFPGKVPKLVLIEGLGPSPAMTAKRDATGMADAMRSWIEARRRVLAREVRRYPGVDEAIARMRAANRHLTAEQARHLTEHGVRTNEDGSVSFKFDPALAAMSPADFTTAQKHALWNKVTCPTLLVYGRESWASNPAEDGRAAHFRDASVELFDRAGHWVQHDRCDAFIESLRRFVDG